jgi:hypothetical protein
MTDQNSTLLRVEPFVRHAAFTLWRNEPHPTRPDDKPIKVPVHYDGRTRHDLGDEAKGRPPNPAPPLTAEQAAGWLAHNRATGVGHDRPNEIGYLGAGFRPDGTCLVCIDLDNCVTPGGWSAEALRLMERFPGALIEQSVSGTGAHIWVTVQGTGPGRRGQITTPMGKIEVYGGGQFIACGTVLGGDASVDHTAAVAALVAEFWPARPDAGIPASAEFDTLMPEQQVAVLLDVASALAVLDPDNRDEWVANGQALQSLGEAGYRLWAAWSARSTRFPGGDGLDKWDSFSGERTDYRAVLARAQRSGWVNPASRPVLPGDASAVFASAVPSALPAGAVLEAPASRQAVGAAAGLTFMAAAEGAIKATIASVETGLTSPEAGVRIAYDVFKDRISISVKDGPWRPLKDTDYGRLRAAFERQGFKAVPAEAMQTAVAMVAEQNQFDSLTDWARGIRWDGTARIARLLPDYYGAEDTPYSRAVGEYAFTTLGGRAIEPGVKADMAVIMVGLQGAGKTSALEVLVPEPDAFGEVDLGKDEDVIARKLRGKCLIELAEMRGFKGRDADANKAWVSRRKEEWTPKYKEFTTTYQRRCLIVGTANDDEQLDDPTGARRFLPIHVGSVDRAKLLADREQLWAEGVHKFMESGIAWQTAEELARAEHHKFEVVDEMQNVVEAFMASPPTPKPGEPLITTPRGETPIRGADILTGCYGMAFAQIKKTDQMALAKIMKKLGYHRATVWQNGRAVKMWKGGGEA